VLRSRAAAFVDVVKAGRTHLMDAVPVTLGQELGGYATQVEHGIERLMACLPRLGELPLGGTAVGTGLNCPTGFAEQVISTLALDLGLPLREARDHFEAQGARDALVEASGAARVTAISLTKIADDLRWMGSGPTAGLGEVHLPDLQPGSSIMPGKVNPVIPEMVLQVAAQVIGNDAAVAWAGGRGAFELNTMVPVMARNLLESLRLLTNAALLLADRCLAGLDADVEQCLRHALSSPALATALNPAIGYEAAAKVVKQAVAERRTIRDVVVTSGLLTEADADRVLDVLAMTRGGITAPSDRRDR
jgi:fumarate hydratase class II